MTTSSGSLTQHLGAGMDTQCTVIGVVRCDLVVRWLSTSRQYIMMGVVIGCAVTNGV